MHRELDRLRTDPLDVDTAYNFFVTAWHLLDWVHPDPGGKEQRKAERDASPLLQLCDHVANGAKHFQVTHKQHQSVVDLEARPPLYPSESLYPSEGLYPSAGAPMVHLTDAASALLGTERMTAVELAERVREYWDTHPAFANREHA
jgi:hypothetical protein